MPVPSGRVIVQLVGRMCSMQYTSNILLIFAGGIKGIETFCWTKSKHFILGELKFHLHLSELLQYFMPPFYSVGCHVWLDYLPQCIAPSPIAEPAFSTLGVTSPQRTVGESGSPKRKGVWGIQTTTSRDTMATKLDTFIFNKAKIKYFNIHN